MAAAAAGTVLRAIAGRSGIDLHSRRSDERRADRKIDIMNATKAITLEGTIMSVLPGTIFRVALANDHLVLAQISGKVRKGFHRRTIGDRGERDMHTYGTANARIRYRILLY